MRSTSRALLSLAAFRRSSGGNIAMLTALMLVPVMGIAGLAVDYSISSLQHSRLTALADSTALLGARRAKEIIEEGVGRINPRIDGLDAQLEKHFKTEASQIKGVQKKIQVDRKEQDVTVTVSWNVNVPSVFGKIFAQQSYYIRGTSASTVSLQPYLHLYLLVDVSQSMGIGASREDQDRLVKLEGCTFACHLPESGQKSTSYARARAADPKINTRVDIAREGVLEIIEAAKGLARGSSPDRIRIGVYTFSNTLKTLVDIHQPISSKYDEISKLVEKQLILGRTEGGTNLMGALKSLEQNMTTQPGDGLSPNSPKVAVIVLSDGVMNSTTTVMNSKGTLDLAVDKTIHNLEQHLVGAIQEPRSEYQVDEKTKQRDPVGTFVVVPGSSKDKPQYDLGLFGAMDPRSCNALKDRGFSLMIIEAEYVMPRKELKYRYWWDKKTEDIRFAWLEANNKARLRAISSKMQACATSPDYFRFVGAESDLKDVLKEMGALVLKNPLRLKN